MSKNPAEWAKDAIDPALDEVDDMQIEKGEPPLSIMVRNADGSPADAFWRTVEKHKLRLPGETDADVAKRIYQQVKQRYAT